jgi:hypothetical protein
MEVLTVHEIVRSLAYVSIARGCGFAALAVVCLMMALSFDAGLSLRTGGFGLLLGCVILLLKADHAPRKPYRRTEVWLMMDARERALVENRPALIGSSLREASLRFAFLFAGGAVFCLGAAEIWSLAAWS